MAGYVVFLSILSLGAWIYLVFYRGNFWRVGETLPREAASRETWPSVVTVVPARNEAAVINTSVKALLKQDYPGKLKILVVDDQPRPHRQSGHARGGSLGKSYQLLGDGRIAPT